MSVRAKTQTIHSNTARSKASLLDWTDYRCVFAYRFAQFSRRCHTNRDAVEIANDILSNGDHSGLYKAGMVLLACKYVIERSRRYNIGPTLSDTTLDSTTRLRIVDARPHVGYVGTHAAYCSYRKSCK